jgi:putative tricarboxylic transport membrane protein
VSEIPKDFPRDLRGLRDLQDLPFGLFLCCAGIVIASVARALPSIAAQAYGPGFFPSLLGVGLAACGLFMVVRSLLRWRRGRAAAAEPKAPIGWHGRAAMAWVIGGLALIALGLEAVGFLICVPVFMVGFLLIVGEAPLRSVLVSVCTTGLAYYAFAKLLKVQVPMGLLQGLF